MMNLNAYVIEIEQDNVYKVCVDGVYSGTVSDNGDIDDHTIDFESALSSVIEIMLSNDYDYVCVRKCRSRKGRRCRLYTVSIDDGD